MTIIYNNPFQFNSFLSHIPAVFFSGPGSCTSLAGDSVMRNMIISKRINFMSCGFCKITCYSQQIKSPFSLVSPSVLLYIMALN